MLNFLYLFFFISSWNRLVDEISELFTLTACNCHDSFPTKKWSTTKMMCYFCSVQPIQNKISRIIRWHRKTLSKLVMQEERRCTDAAPFGHSLLSFSPFPILFLSYSPFSSMGSFRKFSYFFLFASRFLVFLSLRIESILGRVS